MTWCMGGTDGKMAACLPPDLRNSRKVRDLIEVRLSVCLFSQSVGRSVGVGRLVCLSVCLSSEGGTMTWCMDGTDGKMAACLPPDLRNSRKVRDLIEVGLFVCLVDC